MVATSPSYSSKTNYAHSYTFLSMWSVNLDGTWHVTDPLGKKRFWGSSPQPKQLCCMDYTKWISQTQLYCNISVQSRSFQFCCKVNALAVQHNSVHFVCSVCTFKLQTVIPCLHNEAEPARGPALIKHAWARKSGSLRKLQCVNNV